MIALKVFLKRLFATFRRRDLGIEEEIQTHLDLLTEEHIKAGMAPDTARRAAKRAFGGEVQTKEIYRDQRGWPFVDSLLQDVRYALRTMRRSPGFTIVAMLTLGLGIGANTAIFSLTNALSFKALPVKNPDQLLIFSVVGGDESFSYPVYQQFRDHGRGFSGIAATGGLPPMRLTVSSPSGRVTEIVQAQPVSGNLFSVLGVPPVLGRVLTADDDQTGNAQPVVVISHSLWTRSFGQEPSVVGRSVFLNDVPFTIVGVAPRSFRGYEVGWHPDLWWPLQMFPRVFIGNQRLTSRGEWLRLIGRLDTGVTVTEAHAQMEVVFQRDLTAIFQKRIAAQGAAFVQSERERFLRRSIRLIPGRAGWSGLLRQFQQPLVVLMVLVGVVLLIACANVANLLIARAAVRGREIAMRVALGAARARLIRQLLTEGLLLAVGAGSLGFLLSQWGTRFLLRYLPYSRLTLDVSPDVRVLAFTLGISALTGVVFSLVPAIRATQSNLISGLTQRATAGASHRRWNVNHALVITQITLAIVLVFGASLFARTLQNLNGLEMGFDRENVTVFDVDVPSAYNLASRTRLYERLLERLEGVPGVRSATYSLFGFLSGSNSSDRVSVAGYTPQPDESPTARATIVGPRFFETMGTPVVLGRAFDAHDGPGRPRVAIINQTMQRRFFGTDDPIGGRFTIAGWKSEPFEIVGVAADTRYRNLREPIAPAFYVPFMQTPSPSSSARVEDYGSLRFEVRTSERFAISGETIRQAVSEIDQRVAVVDVLSMTNVIESSIAQERLLGQLTELFTVFAVLLAALGLYGVRSYAVTQRTNEIGIRMALGADQRDVFRMMLRGSLELVALGVAIGVPLALVASHAVQTLLFGVRPTDPMILLVTIGIVTGTTLVASHIPARRASRVDPMVALRCE